MFQGSVAPRVLGPRKQNHTGTTVYNGVYRMPLGRFSMALISTVRSIVSVPKRMSALETFRRPISEDVSFGVGTLLVVESNRAWKTATEGGGDLWYIPSYMLVRATGVPIYTAA